MAALAYDYYSSPMEAALRAILAKSRAWVLSLWSLPEPAIPPPAAVIEHRPVDLPHWSPNMPRGAEPT